MSKDDSGHQDKLHITVESNPFRDKSFQVRQTKGMRILNRIRTAELILYLISLIAVSIAIILTSNWKF